MSHRSYVGSSTSLPEQKRLLRHEMRALRRDMAPAIANAANRLAGLFTTHVKLQPGAVIAAYRAFRDEIDPAPLIDHLRQLGHPVALPRVTGKNQPLAFYPFETHDRLAVNKMGIEEPDATRPALDPDIVLVPLLAFDRARNRLGYGGGFYDRTLAGLRARKPIIAVGLAYSFQAVDTVPTSHSDAKLDIVLTELNVF